MLEQARDERAGLAREQIQRRAIVEAVALSLPQGEVDVCAVSRVVRPRLGCKRRDEALSGGNAADSLADEQLLVRRLKCRPMTDGDLLLSVTQLGVVLLQDDLLSLQRRRQLVRVILRGRHGDRREAEARVNRNELAVLPSCERELALERGAQDEPPLGEAGLHPFQERALTDGGGLAVEVDVVGHNGTRLRGVGQNSEGGEVWDEPDLPDRAQPFDRLELIESVHRLHRDRQPDAALETSLQTVPARGLRPHRAVVPAPEETNQPETCLVRFADYLVDVWRQRHRAAARHLAARYAYLDRRRSLANRWQLARNPCTRSKVDSPSSAINASLKRVRASCQRPAIAAMFSVRSSLRRSWKPDSPISCSLDDATENT